MYRSSLYISMALRSVDMQVTPTCVTYTRRREHSPIRSHSKGHSASQHVAHNSLIDASEFKCTCRPILISLLDGTHMACIGVTVTACRIRGSVITHNMHVGLFPVGVRSPTYTMVTQMCNGVLYIIVTPCRLSPCCHVDATCVVISTNSQ